VWVPKISHTRACPQSVACKSGINLNCFILSTFVHPTLLCLSELCESVTDRSRGSMQCVFHHCSILQVPGLGRALQRRSRNWLLSRFTGRWWCVVPPANSVDSPRGLWLGTICPLLSDMFSGPCAERRQSIIPRLRVYQSKSPSLHHFTRILSALQGSCSRTFLPRLLVGLRLALGPASTQDLGRMLLACLQTDHRCLSRSHHSYGIFFECSRGHGISG
jgi:hypothetical protein